MISSNPHVQPVLPADVGGTAPAPGRSLLLVDDEATLRSALRRFFLRRGWRVTEAEDGEHARDLLQNAGTHGERFDAVLTDVRMPRLSGMDLHALVAASDAELAGRFIFSSGDTGDAETAEFLGRTRCHVITKPYELSALLLMVERVADGAAPPAQ
jgi:DNA-binding response OmpR family regulator